MKYVVENSGVPASFMKRELPRAQEYLAHLREVHEKGGYTETECTLNLAHDNHMIGQIEALYREKFTHELKYVVLIGIGGSNLGTKAVYDALYGTTDTFHPNRHPKLICIETCDPELLHSFDSFLKEGVKPEEILFFVVSKSGATTEIAFNAEVISSLCKKHGIGYNRWVAITDEHSPLHTLAQNAGITVINIPKKVGGRFSVLSPVGRAPLRFVIGPLGEWLAGASEMIERCLGDDPEHNPALQSALILAWHIKNKTAVHDTFVFHPELESVGRWYRQLLGESLGKDGEGIIPTVSVGSTDLHSIGQTYLGGPKIFYTTFLFAESGKQKGALQHESSLWSSLVPGIAHKKPEQIMQAILKGTMAAYEKIETPFTQAILPDVSARSVGAFFGWKMAEIMIAGHLLGVNAFDQPAVELYKEVTRDILQGGREV